MRVTREQAAENRKALVRAASRLFRERGVDGVGVAEISSAAGLTHGALYAQFESKDALVAEALAEGLAQRRERLAEKREGKPPELAALLDYLISRRHRDDLAGSCPITASASELARQDAEVSRQFVDGHQRTVAAVEATLEGLPPAERRARALTIVAAEIGTIVVARAALKSDPALSDEMLVAARHVLGALGGKPRKPAGKKRPARRKAA